MKPVHAVKVAAEQVIAADDVADVAKLLAVFKLANERGEDCIHAAMRHTHLHPRRVRTLSRKYLAHLAFALGAKSAEFSHAPTFEVRAHGITVEVRKPAVVTFRAV